MADDDHKREKGSDFYGVLGLRKECTATELRNAYKKLAMRWHPDRCSATGNAKFVEEAKKKFQAIQEAYSVLSDTDKRFMYDVGVYDNDDDDNMQGMGDFLNEMAAMMSQTKCSSVEQHQDPRKGKGITGGGIPGGAAGSRRDGRKQKVSFGHDVSSNDYSGISA